MFLAAHKTRITIASAFPITHHVALSTAACEKAACQGLEMTKEEPRKIWKKYVGRGFESVWLFLN